MVETDNSLTPPDLNKGAQIQNPVIVVFPTPDGGGMKYLIAPLSQDPHLATPAMFGVLLSDLKDQIAKMYADVNAADEKAIGALIVDAMNREDAEKAIDPSRGNMRGRTTITGGKN